MVKVSKGQTDHVDQRQDCEEQNSNQWDSHKPHVETTISQGLEVFNEVRNFTSRLFESHEMTSTLKVTPVNISEDCTED